MRLRAQGKPYALFGTCLGAIVAYEVTKRVAAQKTAPMPLALFPAAVSPPHLYALAVMKLYVQRAVGEPSPIAQCNCMSLRFVPVVRAFMCGVQMDSLHERTSSRCISSDASGWFMDVRKEPILPMAAHSCAFVLSDFTILLASKEPLPGIVEQQCKLG